MTDLGEFGLSVAANALGGLVTVLIVGVATYFTNAAKQRPERRVELGQVLFNLAEVGGILAFIAGVAYASFAAVTRG